jgi:phosphatidyl-myo-inositol dimannoside synthase
VSGPTLAAITLRPQGDGVAVVAGLLSQALQRRWPTESAVVAMFDGPARRPALADKVSFATRLGRHILLRRPRWILFSHMGLTRAMRMIPVRVRRPYAVFLHGTEVWKPLRTSDRSLLRGAALRIANSLYTARRAMQANPDIGPVVPCQLALPDADQPAASHTTWPAPLSDPDTPVVLIVGALRSDERYKGHDQLIAAWPAVVASVPGAHLLIVGDGDDRPRVQALAEQSGVRDAITLLGFVAADALAACYARAALFAMPSRGEGFGLVYLEAMAHRLACIGSRQDAAGEVIEDGVTGLLIDQHDPAALARAIVSLLSDRDRSRAMGLAGHARLQANFTVPAFQSRLATILDAAFSGDGRAAR